MSELQKESIITLTTNSIPQVRERLLKKQRNVCPICSKTVKHPCLDHDHKTGAVRDVLCRNCNRCEGKVLRWLNSVPLDNIELLRRLAKYWTKHTTNKHGLIHPGKKKRVRKHKRK